MDPRFEAQADRATTKAIIIMRGIVIATLLQLCVLVYRIGSPRSRGLFFRSEQDQAKCTRKDGDIGDIEGIGVVKAAARHVQEVRHRAIDQPVDHIADRAADDQGEGQSLQSARGLEHPYDQHAGDRQRHRRQEIALQIL